MAGPKLIRNPFGWPLIALGNGFEKVENAKKINTHKRTVYLIFFI